MTRWILRLVSVAVGLGLLVLSTLWWPGPHQGDERYVVPVGASLNSVAADLAQERVLRWEWQLKLAARLMGGADQIKAGSYRIDPGVSARDLLNLLVRGEVITIAVTLPEGWTADQMVRALVDSLGVDEDSLRQWIDAPPRELRNRLGVPEGSDLEGYLFPETYRFAAGVDAKTVVESLTNQFGEVASDSLRTRAETLGITVHAWVTLASIVEAEARQAEEAPKVAAVYWNRLRKGWKLEADPTVAYVLNKRGQTITYQDLEVDSPYNTYRNSGLPPGPINSPGAAALQATLWPEPDFPAMYFVADGEGGHVFSRTWEEHLEAVRQYRRIRQRQRDAQQGP